MEIVLPSLFYALLRSRIFLSNSWAEISQSHNCLRAFKTVLSNSKEVKSIYKYKNSGEVYDSRAKAREVHEAVLDIEMPYFRQKHVEQEVSQSRGAIHYHMKELVRRGYLIQVGSQYVDAQEIPEWELWQISRLIDRLSQEQKQAHQLSELYQDKKEMAQEHLEELAEQSSNRWAKRQTEEIKRLAETKEFYEKKKKLMREQEKAVTKLYLSLKQQSQENSEKSESPDFQGLADSMEIPA